ncbi:MAG: hypothetical protein EKK55_24370 [Rhodocyclaceae bacterium]|nr:MAG: hypothetical protein EKK55_24370 [Rhodocyclaceae bacterium]
MTACKATRARPGHLRALDRFVATRLEEAGAVFVETVTRSPDFAGVSRKVALGAIERVASATPGAVRVTGQRKRGVGRPSSGIAHTAEEASIEAGALGYDCVRIGQRVIVVEPADLSPLRHGVTPAPICDRAHDEQLRGLKAGMAREPFDPEQSRAWRHGHRLAAVVLAQREADAALLAAARAAGDVDGERA